MYGSLMLQTLSYYARRLLEFLQRAANERHMDTTVDGVYTRCSGRPSMGSAVPVVPPSPPALNDRTSYPVMVGAHLRLRAVCLFLLHQLFALQHILRLLPWPPPR